jgi:PAS domain S-box-containing protein
MNNKNAKQFDLENPCSPCDQLQDGQHHHDDSIQNKVESLLHNADIGLLQLPDKAIQKMIFELQAYQTQLEQQNKALNHAHLELRASRDRYAKLYNLSPVGYITLNDEGYIQEINQAATRLLKPSENSLINQKLEDLVHPSDLDNYHFFFRRLTSGDNEHIFEMRLKNPSGGWLYTECIGKTTYNDPGILEICLSINNITDRKNAEQAIAELNDQLAEKVLQQTSDLSESNLNLQKRIAELNDFKHQLLERETKLNSIFNASLEGIITIDMSGVIVSVNSAVETLFGYSEEEIIGENIAKLIPLAQKKQHAQFLKKYFPTHLSDLIGTVREVEWQRKDHSLIPLDLSIAEFSIDGVSYFTGIVRDVSQRKQQEQQNKEHLEELAHVTRLGLMGEMASGIAHEVNQPLTAITGYTDACLRHLQTENPDLKKLGQILQKTNEQALKAGQIIHRMRDFVKTKKFHRSTADINALVFDATSLCAADFKQNNIVLKYELEDSLPPVYVDYVQIEQVILNLIRNSIDAMKFLPQRTRRVLTIRTNLYEQETIIAQIKDNGPGIEQSEQEKILMPFYTTKTSGMGMGLSISRSIIEAHGGVLHFNSKAGKGTTFYFTLPLWSQDNDS